MWDRVKNRNNIQGVKNCKLIPTFGITGSVAFFKIFRSIALISPNYTLPFTYGSQ